MTIRSWYLVHKWTSLICTAFLLMLCITGLPLIFHEEIEHLTGVVEAPPMPEGTPNASLDASALAIGLPVLFRSMYVSFMQGSVSLPNHMVCMAHALPCVACHGRKYGPAG